MRNDPESEEEVVAPTVRGRHLAVLSIGVLAGLILVTSAVTARGTDLRAGTRTDLPSLIRAAEDRGDGAQAQVDRAQNEVQRLTPDVVPGESTQLDETSARLEAGVGLTALTGPGVRVTLDDAPLLPPEERRDGLGPDDLVVHQQDVQAVVNALWRGGASGIQVMDQRLLTTGAVRCVGNTLILRGRVYSPPYVISAIGPPEDLTAALAEEPGVMLFRDYVTLAGLTYSEQVQDELTVPAAELPALTWARSS